MSVEAKNIMAREEGFSLIEMMVSMTITLILVGLAFTLLAATLRQKTRSARETAALSDATQSMSWMTGEIMNAGFGLSSNGIVSDSNEDRIHIRANLNSFMGETTSSTVTDQGEDVVYQLAARPDGGSALVRSDVGKNAQKMLGRFSTYGMRLGLYTHPANLAAADDDAVLNLERAAFGSNSVQLVPDAIPILYMDNRQPFVHAVR